MDEHITTSLGIPHRDIRVPLYLPTGAYVSRVSHTQAAYMASFSYSPAINCNLYVTYAFTQCNRFYSRYSSFSSPTDHDAYSSTSSEKLFTTARARSTHPRGTRRGGEGSKLIR